MISQEKHLLIETGPGKPCGALMRRYWQPAALSEELTADKPLPVNLLGEELILFRCDGGKPALIGRYCAHQGVDMIYGRVEEDGLRCMYHGWLFDNCGKVIVRGGWVEGGEKRMGVGQPAYPCEEIGGVIYTYMGPDSPPPLRDCEFIAKPAVYLARTKVLRDENYLQGILRVGESHQSAMFVLPNLVADPGPSPSANSRIRWHVPVDDHSHLEFVFQCVGQPSLTRGDPLKAAGEILLKAIAAVSDSAIHAEGNREKLLSGE
jgi:nitrite reductase/ring-hydroxylating ferredoxin subunit